MPLHAIVFLLQVHIAGTAVLAGTRLAPAPGGDAVSELKLEQPVLMVRAHLLDGRWRLHGAVNLEGATMPGGVLTPGAFGEGFVDRRHPHTYLHEAVVAGMLGARDAAFGASLSIGKGFVAFGSDDPMHRPPLRFPVNHHFAQILERAVVIAGVRAGPLVVEGTLFNGDEPDAPDRWPNLGRWGDSWAVRVTAEPVTDVDWSGSYAHVASPEHRPGAGPAQAKWHTGVRVDRSAAGGRLRALAEWARTSDAGGFFVFHSVLVETSWTRGPHRPYYRFERTTRPEEERLLDRFRSQRPHLDDHILGITRFTTHTLGYALEMATAFRPLRVTPLVEATVAHATNVDGGLFQPEQFYGARTLWAVTVGVRVGAGALHRMGRYGVGER
jgi:hypothetical protein